MAHALTFQFATSTNYVLSLAPAGSADIYRAGYVKITARSTTVAMAAVQHNCWIKPVVVEPTGTVPSPAAMRSLSYRRWQTSVSCCLAVASLIEIVF